MITKKKRKGHSRYLNSKECRNRFSLINDFRKSEKLPKDKNVYLLNSEAPRIEVFTFVSCLSKTSSTNP